MPARTRPLLMIPGPVELSPRVRAAWPEQPPGHLAPEFVGVFGELLALVRRVWKAGAHHQPFVVPGSGTVAMEMAAWNLVEPGDGALVVSTGTFSRRMETILRRAGADVEVVETSPGEVPGLDAVAKALGALRARTQAVLLAATHVDTSTGVRLDPGPLAAMARDEGLLSVFDGVCAMGGERFEMAAWDVDVAFTASQKALGGPPGLAFLVASPRALERRRERRQAPPLYLDFASWQPVMEAYAAGRGAYFATPATGLVVALREALAEIVEEGVDAVIERHRTGAARLREHWARLGLREVPAQEAWRAWTMSCLFLPEGEDPSFVRRMAGHGVLVAGGLDPALRDRTFRVGHMGWAAGRREILDRVVRAVEASLS